MHDGVRLFEGVPDALGALAAAGRRVVFVTNSSRRGALVEGSLADLGLRRSLYESVVSSGDVTCAALAARDVRIFGALPPAPRGFHVGAASFVPWLFELGLTFVDDVGIADFIVATGTVRDDDQLDGIRERLASAAKRGAPLVCTNPDPVIPTATGLTLGPGAVAAAYAALGGPIFLYGKPHAPIYAAARRLLPEVPRGRVVAIGDLLETDIRGARAAGLASVLVTGTGAHARALGSHPTAEALQALCTSSGVAPDLVLDRFAW